MTSTGFWWEEEPQAHDARVPGRSLPIIARAAAAFRSIPNRAGRFVREAPLAVASTVLVAAAAAGLLVVAGAEGGAQSHRASAPAIVRPAALPGVPVASVPLRRHRRRHRRHLKLPAITVPASLAAPGESPTVP
jgi:hypothetical protein